MTKNRTEVPESLAAALERRGISPRDQMEILSASLLSIGRLKGLVEASDRVAGIPGDTAEIGVANGGTSRLIARLNGGRRHWACDTFAGLVDVGAHDGKLTNGQFHNPVQKAAPLLCDLPEARLVAGYFPGSAPKEMRSARYSLVHIDVDTYVSVKACFAFFVRRMAPGGVIVLDDVLTNGTVGAIKAFDELENANSGGWKVVSRDAPPQAVVRVA